MRRKCHDFTTIDAATVAWSMERPDLAFPLFCESLHGHQGPATKPYKTVTGCCATLASRYPDGFWCFHLLQVCFIATKFAPVEAGGWTEGSLEFHYFQSSDSIHSGGSFEPIWFGELGWLLACRRCGFTCTRIGFCITSTERESFLPVGWSVM